MMTKDTKRYTSININSRKLEKSIARNYKEKRNGKQKPKNNKDFITIYLYPNYHTGS